MLSSIVIKHKNAFVTEKAKSIFIIGINAQIIKSIKFQTLNIDLLLLFHLNWDNSNIHHVESITPI